MAYNNDASKKVNQNARAIKFCDIFCIKRLNDCAFLNSNSEEVKKLNLKEICDEFIGKSEYKQSVFGHIY